MTDRQARFGRAALDVIAAGGLRALTHRSVDEAVGLPAGSVNYYAPTRSRLQALALAEVYEQMYAIAIRAFTPILAAGNDSSTDMILDCTTDFVEAMSTEGQGVVSARHALVVEAQFDDELRKQVNANRSAFIEFTEPFVAAFGPDSPERSAELVVALIDGLIQQQTLIATTHFPRELIRLAIARIFGFPTGDD